MQNQEAHPHVLRLHERLQRFGWNARLRLQGNEPRLEIHTQDNTDKMGNPLNLGTVADELEKHIDAVTNDGMEFKEWNKNRGKPRPIGVLDVSTEGGRIEKITIHFPHIN